MGNIQSGASLRRTYALDVTPCRLFGTIQKRFKNEKRNSSASFNIRRKRNQNHLGVDLMKSKNGTVIESGQIWKSVDGDMESLVIGVNSDGLPVVETMAGWPMVGEYHCIEKYWRSAFFGELKESE